MEALVDRLMPPDPDTPGGKDAGCAVFIGRQLAGAYGSARGLYTRPPFQDGTKQQGMSQPYTNPLGVTLGPCTYCGCCEWFSCGNYSKVSPQRRMPHALQRAG